MILSITAAILISLCRDFLEDSFDQRLNRYLENIIAKAAPQGTLDIRKPDDVGSRSFSGLFPALTGRYGPPNSGSEPMFKSNSLAGETYKTPSEIGIKPNSRQIRQSYIDGPEGQVLRVLERDIDFGQENESRVFSISVAFDTAQIYEEARYLTNTIVLTLALLGVGLLLATFFQVRFGLSPLQDIGRKIAAIRSGEETRLEGTPPDEILPLQRS